MYKETNALLLRMGLRDRERKVYLACLGHHEGMFISEVVKATRVQRSTVDLTVQRLLQRGFLNRVRVGRRYRYMAQTAETILHRQRQITEDWEKIVPFLNQYHSEKRDTEVTYFEGIRGLRQVHQDTLLHLRFATGIKKDLLAFTSGADFVRLFPDHKKAFIDKRVKLGSTYRAIATGVSRDVPEWQSDKKSLREIKYATDANFRFTMEIQIFADHVMLYSLANPIGGVLINNERIADSLRSLFFLVWNLLPENLDKR